VKHSHLQIFQTAHLFGPSPSPQGFKAPERSECAFKDGNDVAVRLPWWMMVDVGMMKHNETT